MSKINYSASARHALVVSEKEESSLQILEGNLKEEIPLVSIFRSDFGVRIESGHVVGLFLGSKEISVFPDLGGFEFLEVLDLENNLLEEIPKGIKKLKRLRKLDLSKNRLQEFSLVDLPESLNILRLNHNSLSVISINFQGLPALERLEFQDNRITRIPHSIEKAKSLRFLNAADNQILDEGIQESFLGLEKLEVLRLERNHLSFVPPSIGSLSSLKILDLRENQIKTLSNEFNPPEKLQVLYLSGNSLEKIPSTIINHPSLKWVTVITPHAPPPEELAEEIRGMEDTISNKENFENLFQTGIRALDMGRSDIGEKVRQVLERIANDLDDKAYRGKYLLFREATNMYAGNPEEAEKDVTEALHYLEGTSHKKDLGMCYGHLHGIAVNKGDKESAKDYFQKAVEIFREGKQLQIVGLYLQKAVPLLNPDNISKARPFLALARDSFEEIKDYHLTMEVGEASEESIEARYEGIGAELDFYEGLVNLIDGEIYTAKVKFDLAEPIYQKSSNLRKLHRIYNLRLQMAIQTKQPEAAMEALRKILDIDYRMNDLDHLIQTGYLLAWILVKEGFLEESIEIDRRCAEIAKEKESNMYPDLLYQIGVTLTHLGQYESAIEEMSTMFKQKIKFFEPMMATKHYDHAVGYILNQMKIQGLQGSPTWETICKKARDTKQEFSGIVPDITFVLGWKPPLDRFNEPLPWEVRR